MVNDRKIKGIFYYPMEVGHIINKRIRLLFNDHGADGYWIWQCLIDRAYGLYGYYYPVTGDDIDLIAADVCRKPPEVVWAVIESTVKRGLFDHAVFTKHNVLTNDKMQLNFIRGTFDRRRKGGIIYLQEKYLLLSVNELHGIGEQYLDKVIFQDTGLNLRQKIDSDCGNTLFSGGKHTNSGAGQNIPVENPEIPLLKRKRKRKRNISDTKVSHADASQESNIIGLKPVDNAEIADLAKKNGAAPKKKVARKKKGRNPDAEPYWSVYRRVWKDFNLKHLHFNVEPMPKVDYSYMHRIVEKLRERATDQGVPWTEQEAVVRWEKFLSTAYNGDKWLHEHFEMKNLTTQMQSIFKISENGRSNGSVVGKTITFDKP